MTRIAPNQNGNTWIWMGLQLHDPLRLCCS